MRATFYTYLASFLGIFWIISVLVIAILPREPSRPLLNGSEAGDGLFEVDEFMVYRPSYDQTFIQGKALQNVIVKQNMVMEGGQFTTKPARLKSMPFKPSRWMAVPVLGSDTNHLNLYERRAEVALECLETGARIQLLNAPTENWFLSSLRVPDDWCKGDARIVAESTAKTLAVGFGTPLAVSPLVVITDGPLGTIMAIVLATVGFLLITMPFVMNPAVSIMLRLAGVAIYPALAGYCLFVAEWFVHDRSLLTVLALAFFLAPSIWLATSLLLRGERPDEQSATVFAVGCCALITMLAIPWLLLRIDGGMWFPAIAFFPASWSTDNLLSIMAAKAAFLHGGGHPEFLGTWSLSDRGIVQAGQLLSLMTLPIVGKSISEGLIGFQTLQIFGGLIQGTVIPCAVLFMTRILAIRLPSWGLAIFTASTPLVMFNSFYIWPKLSGGLLFLTGFIAFELALRSGRALPLCVAALSITLSLLTHSANSLALLIFPLYLGLSLLAGHHKLSAMTRLIGRRSLPLLATCVPCAFLIHLVGTMDPKSSWPLLFLLTGAGTFGLDNQQTFEVVREFFSRLTLDQFLAIKTRGLTDLFWISDAFFQRTHEGYSNLGMLRGEQMFSLLPSFGPGIVLVAILAAISKLDRRTYHLHHSGDTLHYRRSMLLLAAASLINLLLFVAAFQMPMVVHHFPYGILLGLLLGIFVLAADMRHLLIVGTVVQLLNLLVVWYYGAALTWGQELPRLFSP